MWALVVDEGRAGVRLLEIGVTLGVLAELDRRLAETALEDLAAIEPLAAWSSEAMTIVSEARVVAFQTAGLDQAGTSSPERNRPTFKRS
mgnify:CR=1 FL=1